MNKRIQSCVIGVALIAASQLALGDPPCGPDLERFKLINDLGSGASGDTFEVEQLTPKKTMVMKITVCATGGARDSWKRETANYNNLAGAQDAPLFMQQTAAPFACMGPLRTSKHDWWEESASKPERLKTAESGLLCFVLLEKAERAFAYGKTKPSLPAVRAANEKMAKTALYQIVYAHYLGFVKSGFQNWDLKENNVMYAAWPGDNGQDRMCLTWRRPSRDRGSPAPEQGRCFTKADANSHIIKVMDLDISTSGGIDKVPRVKNATADKTDAKSIKAIWTNIKPNGIQASAEAAFLTLLDVLDSKTPKGSLDDLRAAYADYKAAFEDVLAADFWRTLDDASQCASSTCKKYTISDPLTPR
jgi:hypothetical protein